MVLGGRFLLLFNCFLCCKLEHDCWVSTCHLVFFSSSRETWLWLLGVDHPFNWRIQDVALETKLIYLGTLSISSWVREVSLWSQVAVKWNWCRVRFLALFSASFFDGLLVLFHVTIHDSCVLELLRGFVCLSTALVVVAVVVDIDSVVLWFLCCCLLYAVIFIVVCRYVWWCCNVVGVVL